MQLWDYNEEDEYEIELYPPEGFKPDIIAQWPVNCDYPIWRYFIKSSREKFGKIIIAFTETYSSDDYREFIKWSMRNDNIIFFDGGSPEKGQDWRDMEVNKGLLLSDSKWVWFTEQDFFPTGKKFWNEIYMKHEKGFDLIGVTQGERLHPCCIFVKREVIEKTRKNFGIVPDKSDHFFLFQKDIERLNIKRAYLGDEKVYQYKHLNGYSHNWRLIQEGGNPVYKAEEFLASLKFALDIENEVPLSPRWKEVVFEFLQRIRKN